MSERGETASERGDGRADHRAEAFRRRFFPAASRRDWANWRWQTRHSAATEREIARFLRLSAEEKAGLRRAASGRGLPVRIPPYYAALLDREQPDQPLRRIVVPRPAEAIRAPGESADPLDEDRREAAPGLIHTYPDKALLLATSRCAGYCRYCTRSRRTGGGGDEGPAAWRPALAYLSAHREVRDVLVSGGDPLLLSNDRLAWLLTRLRALPHVEFLRIGTRVPAMLPQRITPALADLLRRFHPLWLTLHFAHPDELTPEAAAACGRLADAGLPLGNQTVLLRGINDSLDVMKRLMLGLLRIRVRPYYLHQCDPVTGSSQFRVPVARGLAIIRSLHGFTTGYAAPTFVLDAPGGGGKVPLLPDYTAGREGDNLLLRNYRGDCFRFPDPPDP